MKRLIAFIVIVVILVGWFIISTVKVEDTTQLEKSTGKVDSVEKETSW